MRAVVYRRHGNADVLEEVDAPTPTPSAGEVVIRVERSAVNPTDWKARRGSREGAPVDPAQTPHQDGAGTVTAVGAGIDSGKVGQRVWMWEAARDKPRGGTAQEFSVLPARHTAPLPDSTSWDLGACLGIPFLTAHRALTLHEEGPDRLGPGTLAGRKVFVAGGAGAVGNAAIQLATWAGATVVTSVSSEEKCNLAKLAGADLAVNYRNEDVRAAVLEFAPTGVDIVVEVAPHQNAALDAAIIADHGVIAMYSDDKSTITIPLRSSLSSNARWQYVYIYSIPEAAKDRAVSSVTAALHAGAISVGAAAGLPIHRFGLHHVRRAHDAVEGGVVGRVIVTVP